MVIVIALLSIVVGLVLFLLFDGAGPINGLLLAALLTSGVVLLFGVWLFFSRKD